MTSEGPKIGDAIVIDGEKYRLRGKGGHGDLLFLARCPKRNPTHVLVWDGHLDYDDRAGVWRADGMNLALLP